MTTEAFSEQNVADLLANLAEPQKSEYAEEVVDLFEKIEAIYNPSLRTEAPVGLSASANPHL